MTVEEALKRVIMSIGISPSENIVESHRVISDAIEQFKEYRAIGTVSEFQQLKEKATAKKPIDRIMFMECLSCGAVDIANCGYCPECGQKLDWSEGKE